MTEFTDAQFMTAAEKALVLKQWKTFLKKLLTADLSVQRGADYGYFPAQLETVFPDRLYKHLSNNWGFIAHYNRLGFLSARFGSVQAIAETILEMRGERFGKADYADINSAMSKELASVEKPLLGKLVKAEYAEDMAQVNEILGKHGLTPFKMKPRSEPKPALKFWPCGVCPLSFDFCRCDKED
jgi:hypothetical protein